MIIDPGRNSCTIWFVNKSKMQTINGTPKECVDRIVKYAIKKVLNKETKIEEKVQWCKIRLDTSGCVGKLYADIFRDKGIEFDAVKIVMDVV